jgi:hypothetical protein
LKIVQTILRTDILHEFFPPRLWAKSTNIQGIVDVAVVFALRSGVSDLRDTSAAATHGEKQSCPVNAFIFLLSISYFLLTNFT